jgi:antitoxin HicB
MQKTLDYYMALPYTLELQYDPEDAWFVRVKELPGCMSQGDTPEEAVAMIQEAMGLWLEVALEDGEPIPEPRELDDYSGKFVVRVPRSLHRDLVEEAAREGVSLNQCVNVALARSVGRPTPEQSGTADEPQWSMLKRGVHQALSAAGLQEEAGELDEQLFANRLDQSLAQVESAVAGGYFQEARWWVKAIADSLQPAVGKSPVLSTFARTVALLSSQAEMYAKLQQGVVNELMLRSRITEVVRSSTLAQQLTREASTRYATASLEPPLEQREPIESMEFVETLFSGQLPVTEW